MKIIALICLMFLYSINGLTKECYQAISFNEYGAREELQTNLVEVCPSTKSINIKVTYPVERKRTIKKQHFDKVQKFIVSALDKSEFKNFQTNCDDIAIITLNYNINGGESKKVCLPKNSVHFYEIKNLIKSLTYSKAYD